VGKSGNPEMWEKWEKWTFPEKWTFLENVENVANLRICQIWRSARSGDLPDLEICQIWRSGLADLADLSDLADLWIGRSDLAERSIFDQKIGSYSTFLAKNRVFLRK